MESITISEAARRLNVSHHQIAKWIDAGLITYVEMPSGRKRIEPAELRRFWLSLPRKNFSEVLEVSEVVKPHAG
jgi:excisionase family DNA binding protein